MGQQRPSVVQGCDIGTPGEYEYQPPFELPHRAEFTRLGVSLRQELHGGHQSRVVLATESDGARSRNLVIKLIDAMAIDRVHSIERLKVRDRVASYDDRVVPIVSVGGLEGQSHRHVSRGCLSQNRGAVSRRNEQARCRTHGASACPTSPVFAAGPRRASTRARAARRRACRRPPRQPSVASRRLFGAEPAARRRRQAVDL